MLRRLPWMVSGVLAVLVASVPAGAGAVTTGSNLSGTITITGTEGKDELNVEFEFGQFASSEATITVTPAATLTATSGTCPPNTDPLTGRPTFTECRIAPQAVGAISLVLDLRGSDDRVVVDDAVGVTASARVNGGLGNDSIEVSARRDRTLRGEDGDDSLVLSGNVGQATGLTTVFDGGKGTDTAGWEAAGVSGLGQKVGVTASLATNTATVSGVDQAQQPTTFRTDTLTAIENLSGTEVGDVLTGDTGANILTGNGGNDNLSGGDGPDLLFGGDDLDSLDGGKDADGLDGGLGIDLYPPGSGGDTFNTRDSYAENITCVKSDVIVNDLVDKVANTGNGCSVSTAAAKHLFDTHLSGRPAKIGGRSLVTKVSCPELKTESCEGKLQAMLGRKAIAHADYRVQPGHHAKVRLPVSEANARKAEGKKIVLSAKEVDADGRDRFVSRPTRVEKAGPRN